MRIVTIALLIAGCANAAENQSRDAPRPPAKAPANTAVASEPANRADTPPFDGSRRRDGRPWPEDVAWLVEAIRGCQAIPYQQVVRSDEELARLRRECLALRDRKAALLRTYAGDAEVVSLLNTLPNPNFF